MCIYSLSIMSLRTERSVVKSLVDIHVCFSLLYVPEILRFALDDKGLLLCFKITAINRNSPRISSDATQNHLVLTYLEIDVVLGATF